jgi:hypothetical protein
MDKLTDHEIETEAARSLEPPNSPVSPSGNGPHLTGSHIACMDFHMKTTLVIPDALMNRLKQEAARRNSTMSQLVERALRAFLEGSRQVPEAPPLPAFHLGRSRVDVANREALYDAMDG